jgi:hypothetical protein
VQLNLPDYRLAVVNTTRKDRPGLTLQSRVVSLDGRVLAERVDRIDAAANAVVTLPKPLDLSLALAQQDLVLLKLTLNDSSGVTVSDNVYWQGRDAASQQALNKLQAQPMRISAGRRRDQGDELIDVVLTNLGNVPVLTVKITVLDGKGGRVLPVYYSDNYVTLLAGEVRHIEVRCTGTVSRCARVALRGWNVEAQEIAVKVR